MLYLLDRTGFPERGAVEGGNGNKSYRSLLGFSGADMAHSLSFAIRCSSSEPADDAANRDRLTDKAEPPLFVSALDSKSSLFQISIVDGGCFRFVCTASDLDIFK